MIILQVFVFDKTYHLVLRDSVLLHPKSAPSVHPTVKFICILYLYKWLWMIEPGAIYPLGVKGDKFFKVNFLVHPESAHWVSSENNQEYNQGRE